MKYFIKYKALTKGSASLFSGSSLFSVLDKNHFLLTIQADNEAPLQRLFRLSGSHFQSSFREKQLREFLFNLANFGSSFLLQDCGSLDYALSHQTSPIEITFFSYIYIWKKGPFGWDLSGRAQRREYNQGRNLCLFFHSNSFTLRKGEDNFSCINNAFFASLSLRCSAVQGVLYLKNQQLSRAFIRHIY